MSRPNRASRVLSRLLVVLSALGLASPASAEFYLDLSAVDKQRIDLVLRSNSSVSFVESIDIELTFDLSALELASEPQFEAVLTGTDVDSPACMQWEAGNSLSKSNCGVFFRPGRRPLQGGDLLRWTFVVTAPSTQTTMLDVSVMLDEEAPTLLSTRALVPEPSAIAFLLAGFSLIGLLTMRRRGRRD